MRVWLLALVLYCAVSVTLDPLPVRAQDELDSLADSVLRTDGSVGNLHRFHAFVSVGRPWRDMETDVGDDYFYVATTDFQGPISGVRLVVLGGTDLNLALGHVMVTRQRGQGD